MKILLIMPRIPAPPNDGGAIYLYHITRHLAMRGHELVVASFQSNRHLQKPDMMTPYCRLYSLPVRFKPYNITAVLKSTITRQPVSVQHRMDSTLMRKIFSIIPDSYFDIISIEGLHSAQFVDIAKAKYPDTPIILRQANVEHLLLKRNAQNTKNPILRLFFNDQAQLMKKFEVSAMKSVDGVTAVTPYDQDKFCELIPDLISEVVPDGADLPPKRNISRDHHTIFAVSNWDWRPNIDGLLWFVKNVWPELQKRYPDIFFEIAGRGISERLQHDFKKKGISYLGFVDNIEIYRQKASVMVAPLLYGSGLKLKILEGLASGVPIVTTSIGSEGIEMKPGRDYLLAETPSEFMEQIIRLLKEPELRDKISHNSRSLIERKYQWNQQAEKLEVFMNRIIEMSKS